MLPPQGSGYNDYPSRLNWEWLSSSRHETGRKQRLHIELYYVVVSKLLADITDERRAEHRQKKQTETALMLASHRRFGHPYRPAETQALAA
jgi:hypothetical protein